MTAEIRNILTGLVLACLCLCLGWLARGAWAQDCEFGAFGCGHQENHERYKGWNSSAPPDLEGNVPSCCNGDDCRPVIAKQDADGNWLVYIPEMRSADREPWVTVPASALQEPDRFRDGRSHVCTEPPSNYLRFGAGRDLAIYCFSPGQVRG